MQKREKILLGVTGGAALFFVVNQFLCSPAPETPKAAPVVATTSAPEQNNEETKRSRRATGQAGVAANRSPRQLRSRGGPVVHFAEWRRDPFQGVINFITTAFDSTVEADNLQLNGIAWRKGQALALIGNAILRKGETVGNLEVLEIREDRVLCRIDGELVTLVLKQDENDFQNP